MTNEQTVAMYGIKSKLEGARRDLDKICYNSGDDNLKGDELEMAKAVHTRICAALDLM